MATKKRSNKGSKGLGGPATKTGIGGKKSAKKYGAKRKGMGGPATKTGIGRKGAKKR